MRTRRLITSILVLLMTISTTLCLSACSSGHSKSFSEAISSEGTHIWFECQNQMETEDASETDDATDYIIEDAEDDDAVVTYGRETQVIWVKVYQDGKLSTYSCLEDVNLGYFSKMTDEEILADLEDTDKYICGQKDAEYDIYLYTDAAGQNVTFEGIPAQIKTEKKSDPMYFMTLISTGTLPTFQVYDSYYGGFELYNYDETPFGEAILVTRCGENDTFTLDSMNLENAVLDYKTPIDVLTELNKGGDGKSSDSADAESTEDTDDSKADKTSEDAEASDDAQSDESSDSSEDTETQN